MKKRHAEPGMVSVEWALTAPVFILCVLVCMGLIFYSNSCATTTNAAREAARSYSLGHGEKEALKLVHQIAGSGAETHIHESDGIVTVSVAVSPAEFLKFLGIEITSQHSAVMEPNMSGS